MALQQLCCQGPPDWTTRLEAITSHVSSPAPPVQAESAAADPRPSALLRKFSVSYDESMCATCPPLATAAPATVLHGGGQRSFPLPRPPPHTDALTLCGVWEHRLPEGKTELDGRLLLLIATQGEGKPEPRFRVNADGLDTAQVSPRFCSG